MKTETLKSRIRADLIWGQIIRGRYQSSFQFSDKDVAATSDQKPEEANQVGLLGLKSRGDVLVAELEPALEAAADDLARRRSARMGI